MGFKQICPGKICYSDNAETSLEDIRAAESVLMEAEL